MRQLENIKTSATGLFRVKPFLEIAMMSLSKHTDVFNMSICSNTVFGIRHKGNYLG
jgi:hypothetical protein